jgi:hypothetical protein
MKTLCTLLELASPFAAAKAQTSEAPETWPWSSRQVPTIIMPGTVEPIPR